jgi:hypothetical protein
MDEAAEVLDSAIPMKRTGCQGRLSQGCCRLGGDCPNVLLLMLSCGLFPQAHRSQQPFKLIHLLLLLLLLPVLIFAAVVA